jgi:hypothetical protein
MDSTSHGLGSFSAYDLTRQSRNQKGSDSAQPEPSEIH